MFLTFEELLTINGMKQANLVAGSKGIHRLIKGAHVVEMIDAEKWVKSGEVLFISGVGLENVEQDLYHIIQDVCEKGAAGIVVEVGPYIKEITRKEKELADALGFPLLALPFEVNISDIISKTFYMLYEKEKGTKALTDFMKEVMLFSEKPELEEKAKLLGFDPLQEHVAVVWSMEPLVLNQALNEIRNEISSDGKLFYLMEEDSISTIIPYSKERKENLSERLDKIRGKLKNEFQLMSVNVGVGTIFSSIAMLPSSVSAAKKALRLITSTLKTDEICYYNEMGIYRILAELTKQDLLHEVMEEKLGTLIAYDKKNNTELLHTLELYIESGNNISRATELLFVHRNTVKQRIKRISELLCCDLSDSDEVFNLQLAFKIKKYLNIE